MFHLSLPVSAFSQCLDFYRDCFGAKVVLLDEKAANLYLFGGQLTLHDKPNSIMDADCRREMHFGHVVTEQDWFAIRNRLQESGQTLLRCREPGDEGQTQGKLLVMDPSGNIVEINSGLPPFEDRATI